MKTQISTAALLVAFAFVAGPVAAQIDWQPFAEEDVVEIFTDDEDGERRETKVWVVVLDDKGYIRTNDSRWLANIRRGSPVTLRVGANEMTVAVAENEDPRVYDRVEEAFKTKYGFMQRVMSTFRISTPTVLELTHP